MPDWIKKALTKTRRQHSDLIVTEPDNRLVLGVEFVMAATISLTILETAHLLILNTWNSEIFSAITGLAGTVTGIFITQKT